MEKISYILTSRLVLKNIITPEKSSICQYGLQIGLEICLNTVISIFIALFCHMEWETIVFFLVFMALRAYAGGLHLDTYFACLICSCASLLSLLFLVKYLDVSRSFSMTLICFSLPAIKFLSPVQDILFVSNG